MNETEDTKLPIRVGASEEFEKTCWIVPEERYWSLREAAAICEALATVHMGDDGMSPLIKRAREWVEKRNAAVSK